ncbi:2'-5' RNA ligase family protein [Gottfriedia sp. NPDC056225]|uniref:2'-5' RNA ligase family protein n=1 Tax=Gottfriedia sp. NPDC056225 TaxID=3345751 RepID=UPI00155874D6|nr:2'-5' RNA ligase family protein [Arthrobacter citreus]
MYGVVALFDEKTEKMIRDIWSELRESSISFYADEVIDRKPHITLASYNQLNLSKFTEQMDKLYENELEINITLNSIGSFLNTGIFYYSPIVTKDLIEFHENFHAQFKQFNDNPKSMYLPGSWVPHCTLANRLTPEKLSEAYNYCLDRNDPIVGKIQEIGVIELVNKNNAPIVYSKSLNAKTRK